MIKDKNVLVNINLRNAKIYREMGYEINIKDISDSFELLMPIDSVNRNSKIKITAICDICEMERIIQISKYWKNFERGGFYSCFGCKNKKKELTIMNQYGVKSFSQTEEFKIKFKETSLKNYGFDNPNKNKTIREKIKKTNLEKYGVDSYFKTEKSKKYNREWMSSLDFREKSKLTLVEKYGVDHYSKTDNFKNEITLNKVNIVDKIRQVFIDKYGVDWYFKTIESKENNASKISSTENKRKTTCIEKYGVDNVSKVPEIYKKILSSKINNGYNIPTENMSEWEVYKSSVRNITNRNKKRLYEEWDGFDYYDDELIKGYLSYGHTHRFYPTIDHKISVIFGFINSIQPEEIGDISNLCITKRYINSMKGPIIEENFIQT